MNKISKINLNVTSTKIQNDVCVSFLYVLDYIDKYSHYIIR
jgi:hypothetical protein